MQHPPYTFIGRDEKKRNTYKGFIIDLMYIIARRLGTFVKFYESPDGRWGREILQDGKLGWDGMIGEVINKEVRGDDRTA